MPKTTRNSTSFSVFVFYTCQTIALYAMFEKANKSRPRPDRLIDYTCMQ